MLKPPHPIARAAYAMAMAINPNNHARDGGRASSQMEIEAVSEIARMFGFQAHLGHLTSGGTFANLEALWIAGQLTPGKRILAQEQAHYTHKRITSVLKLPFSEVAADNLGHDCADIALTKFVFEGIQVHAAKVVGGDRRKWQLQHGSDAFMGVVGLLLGKNALAGASCPAIQRASRLAKVPPEVRWPRCSLKPNMRAISATASISICELARPPSRAWLLGLMAMAMA